MSNQAMCGDMSQAKANRQSVANDIGGSWHRQQQSMTAGWQIGAVKPSSLVTYDLPMVSNRTRRPSPSRLNDS